MEIHVRRVHQSGGPGYVVDYHASFELDSTSSVALEIMSVDPADTDAELVTLARDAITNAFIHVLQPRGLGASVTVRDLRIHPIDISEYAFHRFTVAALETLLDTYSA